MRSASMEARTTASLLAFARVGFVVPRYKHSAVARNRLKRRLRELVRLYVLPTAPACDVVLRVVPSAYDRPFEALREEVQQLAARLARLHVVPPHGAPPHGAPSPPA
ncbi:ribonuclease P protein component [Gemmatimonas aurantiaca T-27]|uniref:Ribonuclease P protein component n=1 Tax=Gemmatimonas aurantiaca (strain DSM 14586 / JCM 11422 / NBRC 100505 / T-27) TaxID=379066 RepID=C1AEP9_GEMAT|nr:ribonuclease P protein component [Gemmatimonas aurantiaca T-27]